MMVALGALVLCACGGTTTTSSEQNPDSTYSIYGGDAGWNFDYSLWVHDRELRYLNGTYAYFELSHSNYSSIIRPTIYNGDLTQSDILGIKVIEEVTAENNGLLGEEGGWSLYTIKQSKTDNVLVAVKGNQRRFYFREIYRSFPEDPYLDSPFSTYWSKAGIRFGHTTLAVYDLLANYKDPLSPHRLITTYSVDETTAIMTALNGLQSDYRFFNETNRPKDRNSIGREMGKQYLMVFADGNDLLPAYYHSQRTSFSSVDTYLYLKDTQAYGLLSAHLDLTYDPTYDPDAHVND